MGGDRSEKDTARIDALFDRGSPPPKEAVLVIRLSDTEAVADFLEDFAKMLRARKFAAAPEFTIEVR